MDMSGAAEDTAAAGRALLARVGCWCPDCMPDGERDVEVPGHRFMIGELEAVAQRPIGLAGLGADDARWGWPWRCSCGRSSLPGLFRDTADAYWSWRRHAGLPVWQVWQWGWDR